jgi:hypothetical protein
VFQRHRSSTPVAETISVPCDTGTSSQEQGHAADANDDVDAIIAGQDDSPAGESKEMQV